ncbi:hypothetical protein D6C00_01120 [Thiohalobacter thiocyanaticus]|uniref:Uncharacterized protein n=1 Tax=Thiohalobacter thiocyanaticus TaxID=585455 RepID=A0A426QG41_9GAMM|nr:hypothetical protein D6C00_01120 [Thiohalobacter thiocyanaticus]
MNIVMNRQDAKGAMYCEPPRRQERQEDIGLYSVQVFTCGEAADCGGSVFTSYRGFLASLAPWRLNGFLGALGVLAVQKDYA